MRDILLTGGTGTLGREVHRELQDRARSHVNDQADSGHRIRVLSRKPHAETDDATKWMVGNLRTGDGIGSAVTGVDTIVHCATGRGDVRAAKNLISAAKAVGNPHVIYISIVGVDKIPLFYYRNKLEVEKLLENSGLPWTILRATQFHNLVFTLFASQRRSPAMIVPNCSFQPIEVREVGARLAELALQAPAGRVPDIGGPQARTTRDLGRAYLSANGLKRRLLPAKIPGRIFGSLRAGNNLCPDNAYGKVTFEEFLAQHLPH